MLAGDTMMVYLSKRSLSKIVRLRSQKLVHLIISETLFMNANN